jgi:hypothetical protein
MAPKDIFTMSNRELQRLELVERVLKDKLTQVAAAEYLRLSTRQVNLIVIRVREEGKGGVIHRLRGRESNRKLTDKLRERVLKLYEDNYKGFGPLLASEKLEELNHIKLSAETLRKWLIADGKWEKSRKGRKHRQRRERKGRLGEMVQMDGSHHDWLEGRGPKLVIMGYIDDATGKVYGQFYEYEGTIPAMDSFKRYVREYGLPVSVYLDKHSTYKSWAKLTLAEELEGTEKHSQFGRALAELGVELIFANFPQAKGRVERLFETLQDRLIKEMRLKGIRTLAEANEFLEWYLPVFNKRFNVIAREEGDLHRDVPKGISLERSLRIKDKRVVQNDFTISYEGKVYQIYSKVNTKRVSIEERLDKTICLYDGDRRLAYKEIPFRPKRYWQKEETGDEKASMPRIPPRDHPWRQYKNKFPAATTLATNSNY